MTKDELKGLGIHNAYNLAERQAEPQVFVIYSTQRLGRAYQCACWRVYRLGHKTAPGGYLMDGGNKTFDCYHPREDKAPKLQEALAWATERYHITEWERSPFGSYHPKGTLAAVKEEATKGGG